MSKKVLASVDAIKTKLSKSIDDKQNFKRKN